MGSALFSKSGISIFTFQIRCFCFLFSPAWWYSLILLHGNYFSQAVNLCLSIYHCNYCANNIAAVQFHSLLSRQLSQPSLLLTVVSSCLSPHKWHGFTINTRTLVQARSYTSLIATRESASLTAVSFPAVVVVQEEDGWFSPGISHRLKNGSYTHSRHSLISIGVGG